jgi:hypothetical protein
MERNEGIKKLYDKLTYFDHYGTAIIMFILVMIVFVIIFSYCFAMINMEPIKNDWPNQRCKPNIIPFAGLINKPDGMTATDFTAQNFNQCTQNILSGITGEALQPLTFVTSSLTQMSDTISNDINSTRGMMDKLRTQFQSVSEEIMGRLMNVMVPLQTIIITLKEAMSKLQGILTAGMLTSLGAYYTLKSFVGVILNLIISVLVIIVALVIILWLSPATWVTAIAATALFASIAVPLSVILVVMELILGVRGGNIPKMFKCFDENTLLQMNDGTYKRIADIVPGDVLTNMNTVTGVFKLEREGSDMYNLNDIIVSDSHILKYGDDWIPVSKHPLAVKIDDYTKPFLYCLNTTSKTIVVQDMCFTDWDEVFNEELMLLKQNSRVKHDRDIHTFLDGGMKGDSKIQLLDGSIKSIDKIQVNDVLERGEVVYGTVEINGFDLFQQYRYDLGNNLFIEGGPNICISDPRVKTISTMEITNKTRIEPNIRLYHLLTNTRTFYCEGIKVFDYNASVDLFSDKQREKLLSLKYI